MAAQNTGFQNAHQIYYHTQALTWCVWTMKMIKKKIIFFLRFYHSFSKCSRSSRSIVKNFNMAGVLCIWMFDSDNTTLFQNWIDESYFNFSSNRQRKNENIEFWTKWFRTHQTNKQQANAERWKTAIPQTENETKTQWNVIIVYAGGRGGNTTDVKNWISSIVLRVLWEFSFKYLK